jgi:hypothetical protein
MRKIPWISQIAGAPHASSLFDAREMDKSEDPLGAAVEIDADGLVLSRQTRVTEVRQETTDDN